MAQQLERFYQRAMHEPDRNMLPVVKSPLTNMSRAKPYFYRCPTQNTVETKRLPWFALIVLVLLLIVILARWVR